MSFDVSRAVIITVVTAFAAACGSASREPAKGPPAETCSATLAPRLTPLVKPLRAPEGPATTPVSRLVAHAELRFSPLRVELENKIGKRLTEERGRDIGVAGSLDYSVDRGPLALSVEGENLVVTTEVVAHAQACAKGRCYASCEPHATARATIPLHVTADYRFPPSRVTVNFTKPCEVRVLGGFVRVDVTPMIREQLAPSLHRVEREIDTHLPPLKPEVDRLWSELSRTRQLPLGGCVVVDPRGLVQGPVASAPDGVRFRFGLVVAPEIRARCGEVPAPRPLPPLTQDPSMATEEDVTLGLVGPLAAFGPAIESVEAFELGGKRARASHVAVTSVGRYVDLDLGLRGEACGEVALRAGLAWADAGALTLATALPLEGEADRMVRASLEPAALAASLANTVRVAPPLPIDGLAPLIRELASSLSDRTIEVSASAAPARPFAAAARGEDFVAWLKLQGSVGVKQR